MLNTAPEFDTSAATRIIGGLSDGAIRDYADRVGCKRFVKMGGPRKRERLFSVGDLVRIAAARILVEGGYTPRAACVIVRAGADEFKRLAIDESRGAVAWLCWRLCPMVRDRAEIVVVRAPAELAAVLQGWPDAAVIPLGPLLHLALGHVLTALREAQDDR